MTINIETGSPIAQMSVYTIGIAGWNSGYRGAFRCYFATSSIAYGSIFRLEVFYLKYFYFKGGNWV